MGDRLCDFTTFGIGGRARRLVVANDRDALISGATNGLILGGGSNVLVSDSGYDGTVVINRYADFRIIGESVTVGSGMRLPRLCAMLSDMGLSGAEWAVGIPGTVGGAVRMNAGAFGGEMSDILVSAEVLKCGNVTTYTKDELGLSYRSSALGTSGVVVSATFKLTRAYSALIKERQARFNAERREKQPQGRSAGSVFKNPRGKSIGRLIESLGLKGLRVGGAEISQKHANVIVNVGDATARDVCRLIDIVKSELLAIGVTAEEEIVYIGDFS